MQQHQRKSINAAAQANGSINGAPVKEKAKSHADEGGVLTEDEVSIIRGALRSVIYHVCIISHYTHWRS